MTLAPGALLCLLTLPFLVVSSVYHLIARRPPPEPTWKIHATNAILGALFLALAFPEAGGFGGDSDTLVFLRLWGPIVFYWWAYTWAGKTLHLFHPPEFTYDRPLIALEERLFGNPSLWMARDKPPWVNELMNFFYWSYYLYTPVLGLALWIAGDLHRFEQMALAVNLGYLICYCTYPWTPLWGPRWALVDEGLLGEDEKILRGYAITRFMNRIMWGDTAHKGGAMPSAHSSTAIVFVIWCWRIWELPGLLVGGLIGALMFVSTVYGRYHYVVDVFVGVAIGLLSLELADLLLAWAR